MSIGSPKNERHLMYFRSVVLKNSSPDCARTPAIVPRGRVSCSRERYVAGVSPSSRSGTVKDSDLETGVPAPPTPGDPIRGTGGSEFCLNRCVMLKRSPKLLRPLVEVDVRPEDAR